MNKDLLLKALDNDKNEQIIEFTNKKIVEMNKKILLELNLPLSEYKDILTKLKGYRYVDEINDLQYGCYLRWIPLNKQNKIELTKGALFCETKITDEGIVLVCKNFGYNSRHFQLMLDNNLIFQKITEQESVILHALDHLHN